MRHRQLARRLALDTLSAWGDRAGRALPPTPRVQLLLLHHVHKQEAPAFVRLLRYLAKNFTFISYSDAVRRVRRNQIDRPYLAFSFDDGQASCLRAASLLERYGASACFFVNPVVVDLKKRPDIEDHCRERLRHAPTSFAAWPDLEGLLSRGHEVGGHTMSHRLLSEEAESEVAYEVSECREVLLRRLGTCDHFAWPYGRFHHISRPAMENVFRAGYLSCASGERGCHGPAAQTAQGELTPEQLCLRRDSVVATWPVRHTRHFLRRAASHPVLPQQTWPTQLKPTAQRTGAP